MDEPSNKVSESPVTAEEEWAKIAEMIRLLCFQLGALAGTSDWICDDMKPRCISCLGSINFNLPGVPTSDIARATVARVSVPFNERANQLLIEMIKIEFELYDWRFLPHLPDAPEMKEKIRRAFTVIEGGKSD
jgi:hypothetical protein